MRSFSPMVMLMVTLVLLLGVTCSSAFQGLSTSAAAAAVVSAARSSATIGGSCGGGRGCGQPLYMANNDDFMRWARASRSAGAGDNVVDLNRPLGLVLNEDEAGNVFVETVAPKGNAARTGKVSVYTIHIVHTTDDGRRSSHFGDLSRIVICNGFFHVDARTVFSTLNLLSASPFDNIIFCDCDFDRQVKEGDIVTMCSATFGTEMWSCRGVGLTRVLAAIRVRAGPTVSLVFESPGKYKVKKADTLKQLQAREAAAAAAQLKKDELLTELEQDEMKLKKGKGFFGLF